MLITRIYAAIELFMFNHIVYYLRLKMFRQRRNGYSSAIVGWPLKRMMVKSNESLKLQPKMTLSNSTSSLLKQLVKTYMMVIFGFLSSRVHPGAPSHAANVSAVALLYC